jgi:hypothetical protein
MLYFKSIMLSYVELALLFNTIIPTHLRLYSYIFQYLYISKASPRLIPYRLKGKKGVSRFTSPYRLNNYGYSRFIYLRSELKLESTEYHFHEIRDNVLLLAFAMYCL